MRKDEYAIIQMNFYSGQETLVKVGWRNDDVKIWGGRVESFEISSDEQLIGCKLHRHEFGFFQGVTWLKMKVRF
jgi:hypothetical protein